MSGGCRQRSGRFGATLPPPFADIRHWTRLSKKWPAHPDNCAAPLPTSKKRRKHTNDSSTTSWGRCFGGMMEALGRLRKGCCKACWRTHNRSLNGYGNHLSFGLEPSGVESGIEEGGSEGVLAIFRNGSVPGGFRGTPWATEGCRPKIWGQSYLFSLPRGSKVCQVSQPHLEKGRWRRKITSKKTPRGSGKPIGIVINQPRRPNQRPTCGGISFSVRLRYLAIPLFL